METFHGKMDSLTAVISPQFCVPGNLHLTIVRKPTGFTNGKFKVADNKGNYIFNVKEKMLSIHGRLLLLDSGSNPIVTFKKKPERGKHFLGFQSVGHWVERSCIVYDKDSTPVAQAVMLRSPGHQNTYQNYLTMAMLDQLNPPFFFSFVIILAGFSTNTL
ncbi:UNVERIFIED_CONTAM: hypothetical protein Sradi_3457000 [Sesamum radiatum]|uniref:Uncharacterized protein n=1 Tax=Sesamum radiatum TaxID=300843 RepID=A0AAW2R6G0_SESRA